MSIKMLVTIFLMMAGSLTRSLQGELAVDINDDKVDVMMFVDEQQIEVSFDYCGLNHIYGISGIKYITEKAEKRSTTDWIGPYVVRSLQSNNGAYPRFTGGWHGSNGDGTGNATGKTESVDIISEDNRKVLIVVTNLIDGYNTNHPIIREKVIYSIENAGIGVYLKGEALEDIEISKYYGLQTQNTLWYGTVSYGGGSGLSYPASIMSASRTKEEGISRKIELVSENGNRHLSAWMMPIGLGDFDHLNDGLPCALTRDYGKSYFNLVNEKPLILNKKDSFEWMGYYMFN